MHKAVFTIDDNTLAYIGYTIGEKYKHYDVPYFDMDTAIQIVEEFNSISEYPIIYDDVYDQFYLYDEGNEEYEIYKTKEFKTAEGIKKLYAIKGGYWEWQEFTEANVNSLAEGIDDFIYEFDTYGYRDVGIDREEMVDEIKNQLKDLETLAEAIEIYYTDLLSADEIFEELSKLLTV